ncbi:MSCRAMM family protein [Natrononativus amylolyticus]|uniref:MSCRAMM family protein n=1 Tax=Natrononativus amylolyticus TaxID=2963434 RepID=UPI0020CE4438|nr:hypothetical protein [Natrononativus amylolyticus]
MASRLRTLGFAVVVCCVLTAGCGAPVDNDTNGSDSPTTGESTLVIEVVDDADEPVPDVAVSGAQSDGEDNESAFSGETDDDGRFSAAVVDTDYEIELTHEAYAPVRFEYSHDGDSAFTVSLTPLEDAGEVRLRVVDPETGDPLHAGVETNATDDHPNTTDEEGEILLEGVSPGEYAVTATELPARPNQTNESTVFTVEETPAEIDVAGVPLPGECRLDVEIRDAEANESLGNATVGGSLELFNHTETAALPTVETDDNGSATLEAVCGWWDLDVGADGYENATESLTVENDSDVTVGLDPDDSSSENSSADRLSPPWRA